MSEPIEGLWCELRWRDKKGRLAKIGELAVWTTATTNEQEIALIVGSQVYVVKLSLHHIGLAMIPQPSGEENA